MAWSGSPHRSVLIAQAYPNGKTITDRFDYEYNDRELYEVIARAYSLGRQADDVHVIFNNNRTDYAPKAAERLQEKLGQTLAGNAAPKLGTLL